MSALIALFGAAWSRAAGWAATAGVALAALATLYAAGRRDGRRLSETDALRRDARAREIRDAVERDLDRGGDAAGELRRDWQRK